MDLASPAVSGTSVYANGLMHLKWWQRDCAMVQHAKVPVTSRLATLC